MKSSNTEVHNILKKEGGQVQHLMYFITAVIKFYHNIHYACIRE